MISSKDAEKDFDKIASETISDTQKIFKALKIVLKVLIGIRSNQRGGTEVFNEKYKTEIFKRLL
jgi:3-dehydroquinate dehydratase